MILDIFFRLRAVSYFSGETLHREHALEGVGEVAKQRGARAEVQAKKKYTG